MDKTLNQLVYDSLSIAEFECGWQKMLVDYDATQNEHLQLMYSLRKMWVPIYFKDVFCPFIQSTSRSESTNSYFKDFVIPKDTLENFMRQFQVIREASTAKEDENMFTSLIKEPTYCTQQKIERQAAKIYNRDIFVKMQTELYNSGEFAVEENIKDYKYTITKSCYYSNPEFYKKKDSLLKLTRSSKSTNVSAPNLQEMEYYAVLF